MWAVSHCVKSNTSYVLDPIVLVFSCSLLKSIPIDLDTFQPIAPKLLATNAATTVARKGTLPRNALNLAQKTNSFIL